MIASTSSHGSLKGILKNKGSSTSSVEDAESGRGGQVIQRKKSQRWDESNLLATHRNSYRGYDLMKADDASTSSAPGDEEGTRPEVQGKAMTPDILAEKLAACDTFGSSCQVEEQDSNGVNASKFLNIKERQRQFELKRKLHYNEALNIKLARQLISEEMQSEVEEDETQQCLRFTNEERSSTEEAPRSDKPGTESHKA